MRQQIAKAIVLSRTNYGESDRILSLLTSDKGKIRLVAKGVRKSKSKNAGGIELLSINTISYLQGSRDLGTLISARSEEQYDNIVKDIERTMFAYDLLKKVHTITEDEVEEAYFSMLEQALKGLDDLDLPLAAVKLWAYLQLLLLMGHTPNLSQDTNGKRLRSEQTMYLFNFEHMAFSVDRNGTFNAHAIKLLRLVTQQRSPLRLRQIRDVNEYWEPLATFASSLLMAQLPQKRSKTSYT
jgi:DNA repair protein RecO (recombination protein O)